MTRQLHIGAAYHGVGGPGQYSLWKNPDLEPDLTQNLPSDFRRFTAEVIPILQERGLFRTEDTSETLRGHLGLTVPENRHTAARRAAEAEASR